MIKGISLVPFKVIGYPFKLVGQVIREIKEENETKNQEKLIENFKKSLLEEDLALIREEFILEPYFDDIKEQISLYKDFKAGKVHKGYLKQEVLVSAYGNNSLYVVKPEKIEELRGLVAGG